MFENLIDKTLTNLNKSNIILSTIQCIRKRYNGIECKLCSEYCPVDCIKLGETVEVDFEKCIECGVCVNACPTEVFIHKKLRNGKVMSRLKQYAENLPPHSPTYKGGVFLFSCSMAREDNEPAPPGSVVFPCLGFLTEAHLIGVVSYLLSSSPYFKGRIEEGLIKGGVILDCTLCNECEFEKGIKLIKKTADSVNKLLSVFGKDEMIEIVEKGSWKNLPIAPCPLPPAGEGASRRDFFSSMKNGTYKMLADSIEDEETVPDEPIGNLPSFLPKRREMLIRLLQRMRVEMGDSPLNSPQPPLNLRGGEGGVRFPFIQLSIDDRCNFCDMCSTFCPTGAIEKIKTVDDITITFNISKCVNCYPCYNLCPKNAMSSGDIADINGLLDDRRETLISRGMTECIKCEMPFLDFEGKGVCRRCEKLSRFEEGYLSKVKS